MNNTGEWSSVQKQTFDVTDIFTRMLSVVVRSSFLKWSIRQTWLQNAPVVLFSWAWLQKAQMILFCLSILFCFFVLCTLVGIFGCLKYEGTTTCDSSAAHFYQCCSVFSVNMFWPNGGTSVNFARAVHYRYYFLIFKCLGIFSVHRQKPMGWVGHAFVRLLRKCTFQPGPLP